MAGRDDADVPSFQPVRPDEPTPAWFDDEQLAEPEPEEPAEPFSLQDFARRHWLPLSMVASLVASPLFYLALASSVPALALLLTTIAMYAAFSFLLSMVWPLGEHITWQRRAEVFGYRAAAGLATYLFVGVMVVLAINATSPRTIPLELPLAIRFVPFWPFYAWFVLGCEGLGPCPPPPG